MCGRFAFAGLDESNPTTGACVPVPVELAIASMRASRCSQSDQDEVRDPVRRASAPSRGSRSDLFSHPAPDRKRRFWRSTCVAACRRMRAVIDLRTRFVVPPGRKKFAQIRAFGLSQRRNARRRRRSEKLPFIPGKASLRCDSRARAKGATRALRKCAHRKTAINELFFEPASGRRCVARARRHRASEIPGRFPPGGHGRGVKNNYAKVLTH